MKKQHAQGLLGAAPPAGEELELDEAYLDHDSHQEVGAVIGEVGALMLCAAAAALELEQADARNNTNNLEEFLVGLKGLKWARVGTGTVAVY